MRADDLICCLSRPSLLARAARETLAALRRAGRGEVRLQAIRLEGDGPGLAVALRAARDAGARAVRVRPLGFPMSAGMLDRPPGAVAHWQATDGAGVRVRLAGPPAPQAVLPAMVRAALDGPAPRPAVAVRPGLGKPGWPFLPDHDTRILDCTGPRCAFCGAGPLLARTKAVLAAAGLSDRCLTTVTGCLLPCNQGPLVATYPRNGWYLIPDGDALRALAREVIGKGGDLSALRLVRRPRREAP